MIGISDTIMSGGGARKWRFGDWAFEDASAAPVSFFMPIKFNRSTNTAGQMYKKKRNVPENIAWKEETRDRLLFLFRLFPRK